MRTTNILVLGILIVSLIIGISNATAQPYEFNTTIADEGEYLQQTIPIINDFREQPLGRYLLINGQYYNHDEFMQQLYYPNHPCSFLRGDEPRISTGTSRSRVVADIPDDTSNGNGEYNGDNGNDNGYCNGDDNGDNDNGNGWKPGDGRPPWAGNPHRGR